MLANPMNVQEISAAALAHELEAGAAIQLLDVRAPFRLASGGRIELGELDRFINIAGSELMSLPDPASTGLDPALPVVTVCGHGNSSRTVAQWLQLRGYSVMSLAGGMAAWMDVVVPRVLVPPPGFDHLIQFDRVGKGALGYLLVSAGEALAVDPPRDIHPYEQQAAALGARITGVVDTHVHADYISGAPQLAANQRASYYLHPADSSYAFDGTPGKLHFEPLADCQQIKVGAGAVTVWHNPGHTEGSVTLVAGDAAFTGDFIFIESVGRPDLADRTEEWTEQLFASLQRAKQEWPLTLRILPAHYAGQSERGPDRSIGASFGELLSRNAPLGIDDPAQFREWVAARLTPAPLAYRRIKGINVGLFAYSEQEASELEAGKNECAA